MFARCRAKRSKITLMYKERLKINDEIFSVLQIEAKYDVEQEEKAREWIEAVLGERIFQGKEGIDGVHEVLRSGVVLIRYIFTEDCTSISFILLALTAALAQQSLVY